LTPPIAPGKASPEKRFAGKWHVPGIREIREDAMKGRGFTLIELLVTLTIVTILVTGAAELISLSLLLKRKADAHAAAARLVAEKLEGLRALPFDDDGLRAGADMETVAAAGEGAYVREWVIDDLSASTKRIGVHVSSDGRTIARAVLLMSRDLGFGP
jgi:prepilin-type N-terminal cleavage/methylation domain-containing protein